MASVFDFLTQPIAGVPVWFIIAVGVLLYIAVRYGGKPKVAPYKEINVEKEVQNNFDELLTWFGIREGVGKSLRTGIVKVGTIKNVAIVPYDGNITKLVKSKTMRKLIELKGPDQKEAYLLKVTQPIIDLPVMDSLLVKSKKFLIDSTLITAGEHELNVPITTPFSQIFNVFVSSTETEFLVSDQAHLKTLEQALQSEVNFIPKGSYLENLTAQRIAQARENAKLEKEKYKGQIEGAESG